MKSCERSIARLFLESIEPLASVQDEETLPNLEKDILVKNKEDASKLLATSNINTSNAGEKAARLLRKASTTPQTWASVYQVIEDFRNDVAKRDKFNSTATPVQVGMASVLHILFSLVVETNLLIEPLDVNIVINTFKNNFTSKEQVDALEKLVNSL